MLAAITSRTKPDDDEAEKDTDPAPAPAPAPVPPLDPRAAMLSAIASRKKPDDEEGEQLTVTASPDLKAVTSGRRKFEVSVAIIEKVESETENVENDSDEESISSSMRDYLHDFGIVTHLPIARGEECSSHQTLKTCDLPLTLRFAASVFFHQMVARSKHASASHLIVSENIGNYFTFLGPMPSCSPLQGSSTPYHNWEFGDCIRNEIQGKASVDAKQIIVAARANLKSFEKLIDRQRLAMPSTYLLSREYHTNCPYQEFIQAISVGNPCPDGSSVWL
jgi:hypothetical protein